ncbi:hypothetical protein FRC11_013185, partial [Ceratobasidium sp. 423]
MEKAIALMYYHSMVKFSGVMIPAPTRDFEGSTTAYVAEIFSINMSTLMGTSIVTAFIESATSISGAGEMGLTAIVAGICFLISVLFAPFFGSIPGHSNIRPEFSRGVLIVQIVAVLVPSRSLPQGALRYAPVYSFSTLLPSAPDALLEKRPAVTPF